MIFTLIAMVASGAVMIGMVVHDFRPSVRSWQARKRTEKFDADGAKRSPGTELAIPVDPEPVYELYGHPAPPIPLLGASLPSAPLGYGWEIHVVPNDDGNPALRLAMLDLKTSAVIDAIEGDMVIVRRWKYANDETYASFYRRAEAQSAKEIVGREKSDISGMGWRTIYNTDHTQILGKVMMGNLITPMVDWARLITLRYIVDHPDESKCNYMLIESEPVNA